MRVDLQEFRAAYLAEVDEHLSGAHQRLLDIETSGREGRVPARELRELMRLLHTIKGLSSMVGVEPVVDIAHEMEGVVRAADHSGGAALSDTSIEALLEGLRAIESCVAAVAKNEPSGVAPSSLLSRLSRLASIVSQPQPLSAKSPILAGDPLLNDRLTPSELQQLASPTSGRRAIRLDFAPSSPKADAGISITTVRDRIARIGELVRVMPIASQTSEHAPSGLVFALFIVTDASDEVLARLVGGDISNSVTLLTPPPPFIAQDISENDIDTPPRSVRDSDSFGEVVSARLRDDDDDADPQSERRRRAGFLRVDVTRVDDAIEKLSSLIVTRSRLQRAAAKLAADGANTRELETILLDTKRQLRDLRSALLGVRMVPLSSVLDRLPLVARGLGRTTGKKVRLVIEAGDAELDKTVAERLFPAFVHLIRNAVDHGIEEPAARVAAGKPELGTIRITAVALGNRVVDIRIADDGAGIDAAKVAGRAGASNAPLPPPAAVLLEMICRPGLSTRDTPDQSSGRGIGMDIAKRTIEALGGELALETTPDRGTTFLLRVPLTIAVVDAFTVSCGGRRFAVPVPAVAEILEVTPELLPASPQTNTSSKANNAKVQLLGRRGETIALVELSSVLGLDVASTRARPLAPSSTAVRHAVVVRRSANDDMVAFAIDKVLGQQEAVIRPLIDPLVSVLGISGSTDLGDGEPTLVLDLIALSTSIGGSA